MKLMIGENIRAYRKKHDLTQEELAERLGVTYQSVRWENGATYPDLELLPAIAQALSITADELLGMPEVEKEKRATETLAELRRECVKPDYDAETRKKRCEGWRVPCGCWRIRCGSRRRCRCQPPAASLTASTSRQGRIGKTSTTIRTVLSSGSYSFSCSWDLCVPATVSFPAESTRRKPLRRCESTRNTRPCAHVCRH